MTFTQLVAKVREREAADLAANPLAALWMRELYGQIGAFRRSAAIHMYSGTVAENVAKWEAMAIVAAARYLHERIILERRAEYGGRKGRSARKRLAKMGR